MKTLWLKVYSRLGAVLDWFELQRNRKKAYNAAVTLCPVLTAMGYLSTGDSRVILVVLGVLSGTSAAGLAAKHS